METRSTQKHIRISPRKVKIVLDLIRGKDLGVAVGILKNTPKAASEHTLKLLTKVAEKLHVSKPFCHNTMLRRYGQIETIGDKPVYLYIRESDQSEELVNEAETYHLAPTSQVRIGNDGIEYRTYKMIRGSHTYNTEEMSHLIDGIVSEAKELGIETLPPDEIERMMSTWQNR